MKIAVLLRGQMRFSQEGAYLFEKFVIDKFPQHEFDFFVSTPLRIQNLLSPLPKFSSENLSIAQAETEIRNWSRVRLWQFQTQQELFEPVKKIVLDLATDKRLYDWLAYHNEKYSTEPELFNFSTPPLNNVPIGDYTVDFVYDAASIFYNSITPNESLFNQTNALGDILDLCKKMSDRSDLYQNIALKHYAIDLHNFMSQYYSFARSFVVLKNYMNANTEYKPDLVWSTRSDVFHLFDGVDVSDKFDLLLDQLDKLRVDALSNNRAIITNRVIIDRNQPYVCDLNFFSTVEMLDNILDLDNQTCQDIIVNAMTKNKTHFVKTKDAANSIQHVLWSAIFSNACFRQANGPALQFSSVIRHSFDHDEIKKMTGTTDDGRLLKQMTDDFKYPASEKKITAADIVNEFDYLSSN